MSKGVTFREHFVAIQCAIGHYADYETAIDAADIVAKEMCKKWGHDPDGEVQMLVSGSGRGAYASYPRCRRCGKKTGKDG